jgi:hypothetical protein
MSSTEIAVFSKIEDPLAFVEKFGESMAVSGMFGQMKKDAGRVMAMACLCEQINPIEFARTYHVIEGRLSMRADAMHAAFRKAGGRVKWLNTGDDAVEARAAFTFEGEETELCYKMSEAENAGRAKKGSNYDKDPGSMLRARLVSRAVRMLCPEIVSGYYTPEEIEASSSNGAKATTGKTKAEAKARKEELQAMNSEPTATVAASPEIIDVEATSVTKVDEPPKAEAAKPSEEVPFATDNPEVSRIKVDQRQQIVAISEQLGSTEAGFAEHWQSKHGSSWMEMSEAEATDVIEKLEAAYQAKLDASK